MVNLALHLVKFPYGSFVDFLDYINPHDHNAGYEAENKSDEYVFHSDLLYFLCSGIDSGIGLGAY